MEAGAFCTPYNHLTLQQCPRPDGIHDEDVEKAEDKAAAEHYRVILPSIIWRHPKHGHDDSPWEYSTHIANQRLVKVPSGSGSEQNRGKLRGQGVEDGRGRSFATSSP